MWTESDLKDEIERETLHVEEVRRELEKLKEEDYDETDMKSEREELEEMESRLSVLREVLRSEPPVPGKKVPLAEHLRPLKEQGFFCQIIPDMTAGIGKILTITKTGLTGRSYKFSLEDFMKNLILRTSDYTVYQHSIFELDIGLIETGSEK